ncbi:MAG TPA: hemin receptor, partial [Flavobacteriia bacterium]|nr:hemin receptor [Flavobacteriia bacterium]
MKKIFFLALLFLTMINSFGQTIGYDAFGLLLSKEDLNGTARYTAMSGAFGALGGNLSA